MATLPEVIPTQIPILILNVHSHCNCRCLMCDIWQRDTRESVRAIDLEHHRASLHNLGVRHVVLTGGEPLLNTDLTPICDFFREQNIRLTLLTTGLLLKKRAQEVAAAFDDIIISIDGPPAIHDAVRRVPGASDLIAEGITAVRKHRPGMPISARCTIQKSNHAHIAETVAAAKQIGLDTISFLAADTSSTAFNRELLWPIVRQSEVALTRAELATLEHQFDLLDHTTNFIVESPAKLRKIAAHFRAHLDQTTPTAPICNAPWVSAVIEIDGSIRPCFFHPPIGTLATEDLQTILTGPRARAFRDTLDVATNPTCQRCVCSLNYRPESILC